MAKLTLCAAALAGAATLGLVALLAGAAAAGGAAVLSCCALARRGRGEEWV